MLEKFDWHVAVYCWNEQDRLAGCLDSILAALQGQRALVTVVLNGSTDGGRQIADGYAARLTNLEVVSIAHADKSNAINQFIHRLRVPARAYGAVDGYAHVGPATFQALSERLAGDAHAQAVTGVCVNGRTMRLATEHTLKVGGQLHGQLHAFRGEFLDRMVERGIRLPVGLYRGDGLLGSMAAHDLDAVGGTWDNARVAGVAQATYTIPELSPFRIGSVRRQWRRKIRQQQGRIENLAIEQVIRTMGFEGLPATVNSLVEHYLADHPRPKATALDRPFQTLALRQLSHAPPLAADDLLPGSVVRPHPAQAMASFALDHS